MKDGSSDNVKKHRARQAGAELEQRHRDRAPAGQAETVVDPEGLAVPWAWVLAT